MPQNTFFSPNQSTPFNIGRKALTRLHSSWVLEVITYLIKGEQLHTPLLLCKLSVYSCLDQEMQGSGTWKKEKSWLGKVTIFQSRLRHLSKTCSSSSSSCYLSRALLCIVYFQTLHWGPGASLHVVNFLYLQHSVKLENALGTGDP